MDGMILQNPKERDEFFDIEDAGEQDDTPADTLASLNESLNSPDSSVAAIAQEHSENWAFYRGDSCEVIRGIPDNSIDFSVYSPPFASLYVYSNSERDLGNSRTEEEFFDHYRFLIQEKLRITRPGRNSSVHCMNLPTTKQREGIIGISDFRGAIIREHVAAGWIYHSEACIWKDPVTAMQRTKALGLLHKQVVKDSCMSRMGIADYVVTFRKPGQNNRPVAGEFDRFIGDQTTFRHNALAMYEKAVESYRKYLSLKTDQERLEHKDCGGQCERPDRDRFMALSDTKLSIDVWQRYASPVWSDIDMSRTLNKTSAREENDGMHVCPLQLDVIERCLELWSNPGDVVWSSFGGIGSEGYCAVKAGRKFVGCELKESYWRVGCKNLRVADEECRTGKLF